MNDLFSKKGQVVNHMFSVGIQEDLTEIDIIDMIDIVFFLNRFIINLNILIRIVLKLMKIKTRFDLMT